MASSSNNQQQTSIFSAQQGSEIHQRNASKTDKDLKCFTLEELAKYNGKDHTKIYMAVKGNVYDVTDSGFYGDGEPYDMFAGKDGSINLAEMSMDQSTLNQMDLSQVSQEVIADIVSRAEYYDTKYEKIGWVKEWREMNKDL